MKLGKRRRADDAPRAPDATAPPAHSTPPPHESVVDSWTVPVAERSAPAPAPDEPVTYEEPVVEGEAVELAPDEPGPPAFAPPVPRTMEQPPTAPAAAPFPVAEEPVAVGTPGHRAPVTSLGDSAEAYASGHAAAPGPSWQEPVMELANERPELVVAAAFGGGVLAAMILRRLGN